MSKALKFICPDCQSTALEECLYPCSAGRIVNITSDGQYKQVGEEELYDVETEHYRCKACGFTIEDKDGGFITQGDELAQWLAALPCNSHSDTITEQAVQIYEALKKMRTVAADLQEVINDTMKGGRLTADALPDDFLAICHHLEKCAQTDQQAQQLIASIEG